MLAIALNLIKTMYWVEIYWEDESGLIAFMEFEKRNAYPEYMTKGIINV